VDLKLVIEKVIDYNRVRFKYCTDGETLADTPAVDPAIQMASLAALSSAINSVSVLEWATTGCFLIAS
jgi:hypothetical protein